MGTAAAETCDDREERKEGDRRWAVGGLFAAMVLFGLMGLLGLVLRLQQADLVDLPWATFYEILTLHGTGMIATVLLAAVVGSWYVLNKAMGTERVPRGILATTGLCFAGGVALFLAGILMGFASGWTMLHPLPMKSGGMWGPSAFLPAMAGMLVLGLGGLLYFVRVGVAAARDSGGLARALAWEVVFFGKGSPNHPAVLIMTVTSLAATLGLLGLAASVVGMLLHWAGLPFDYLLAKNLIYFGGHTIANITIYCFAAAVYASFPRYTGRPWLLDRVVAISWNASLVLVLLAYFHHLYMDLTAQPYFLHIVGLIGSYGAAFPAVVVTIFGALLNVYKASTRWRPGHLFQYGGLLAWVVGGFAAVVDATPAVNFQFHNTMWVPGHFHTYLLLGVVSMMIGMAYYVACDGPSRSEAATHGKKAFWAFHVGGYGLAGTFLLLGVLSVPRRFTMHPEEVVPLEHLSLVFVLLIAIGLAVASFDVGRRLGRSTGWA